MPPPEGYATDWTAVVLAGAIGFVAMGIMFVASMLLAPRRPSKAKALPYESGIEPSLIDSASNALAARRLQLRRPSSHGFCQEQR